MKRRLTERSAFGVLLFFTFCACSVLVFILATVVLKGLPSISWPFLTQASSEFGSKGGIFYQIIGTLILMAGAAAVSLPVALGSALFQTEYLTSTKIKWALRILMVSLNSVPTIIFGLVGYVIFGVFLQTGVSWVTGSLILAIMILPTLQMSILTSIESLPIHYRETGMAMGLSPWERIKSIVIPQSFFGIVTGMLLGLARAGGETAAIMFTATVFSGVLLPESWTDPVTTLQTHILVLAQEAINPEALANAWGAGLVLLAVVFVLILGSLVLRTRSPMESEQ